MSSPILQALDTFLKAKQEFSDALQKHSSEDDKQFNSSLHMVNEKLLSNTYNTKCISAPDLKKGIDDVKELETKLAEQILKTKKAEKEAKKLKKQIKKLSSDAANEECCTSQENKRVKIKE